MKKTSKTVVFFGSGPVAAKSLEFINRHFSVEAVVTKPRPPHHRGSVPVLELAEELKLTTHTVSNKQELEDLLKTAGFKSQVGILIDFAIIVTKASIDSFPLGIVNSHFSLLPQWRGPDPITFSILSGQEYSGTSLMLLAPGVDEGPLLAQAKYDIPPTMTTPELTDELIELSNQTIKTILPLYIDDKIDPAPQENNSLAPSEEPTYSSKISKQDGVIDWEKPAKQIEREIRAYLGWPGSRTTLLGKDVTITEVKLSKSQIKPGQTEINGKLLFVGTSEGSIEVIRLKPAGKKEMSATDFISGYAKK